MRKESMMKWRLRKEDRFSYGEHDEVRRSLEVLDNVLAEFDECNDSWDSSATSHKFQHNISYPKVNEAVSQDENYLPLLPLEVIGGSTKHIPSHVEEQVSINSPPPIPKRSPTTQLSENIKSNSIFHFDDTSLESYNSFSLDSNSDNIAPLSTTKHEKSQIRSLSLSQNDAQNISNECDNCSNCGRHITSHRNKVIASNKNSSLSAANEYSQLGTDNQTISNNSKLNMTSSNFIGSPIYGNVFTHSLNCASKERMRQLDIKFQRVRELLKQNKIKPLDKDPPNFIPPPPPTNVLLISSTDSVCPCNISRDAPPSFGTKADTSSNIHDESSPSLCNRCSLSGQSPTVEDIPNLLPTDILVRPQLGLSYSLEDDLSPGVKEIGQTSSTPKNDLSLSSSFKAKEVSGLCSTFSNSASSLGYVSSQSELELNSLTEVPDKVPLSSFKSVTLPNGLDSFPFYSSFQQSNPDRLKRHNSQNIEDVVQETPVPPIRNASADLLVEEKPKKKDFLFSRFSRKNKKSVKK